MKTIAHPAPATTREERGLALYLEHGDGIEEIVPDFYLVPSADGEKYYHVDYRSEVCDCPDYRRHHGAACKHVYAVGIKLAKRRSKAVRRDGCGERHRRRDMYEVGDDHPTFFEGDELCRPCAHAHGVI